MGSSQTKSWQARLSAGGVAVRLDPSVTFSNMSNIANTEARFLAYQTHEHRDKTYRGSSSHDEQALLVSLRNRKPHHLMLLRVNVHT